MTLAQFFTVVGSALAGWLLAQITDGAKELHRGRKLRRAISEEVVSIHEQASQRMWLALARDLQICVHEGLSSAVPLPLNNQIYRTHYAEVALHLNVYQRSGLEILHQQVDALNEQIRELGQLKAMLFRRHSDGKKIAGRARRLKGSLHAALYSVAAIRFYAHRYIDHPLMPHMTPNSPEHKAYLKMLQATEDEISDIEEKAKTVERAQFDVIYNAEMFKDVPDE